LGVEFQTHPIMNIKRNIIFALESRKKNGVPIVENVPIRMRVIFASQRIEFTTGYRIDVAKWDADKQRVKNGCTNKLKQSAAEINTDLLKYYAEIQNIFKEFEVQEVMPTTQQLKEAFNMRMKDTSEEQPEEAPVSFWEVFDEFVKECGNQNNWTASTYEKFAAVRNHLKEFKEDATFNYFDEFGLNEYVNFLRDTKDMRNSTIGKQMGFLKWFLRWSFKKGHHQNIAYDTFKPKLKTTSKKVIFLTWDELNKLKDYQIPKDKQYLERVRDVFLFCCFTSLRYSDVRNLKRSDVKSDHIEITTVKTADSLTIELNKYSKAILDKYKDIHFENYMALPVISNQKMNDYLKELGELAEINEPVRETYYKGNERIDEVTPKYALLSTHAGRRTFICNALALGIPVMPTTQQLKEAFNMRMKDTSEEQPEEAPVSFWEVFDEFVKECGNQNNWTASTYEKFAAVRNHLKEFKEDATFNYFNEFGLNEYVNFLRDTKDMRNSTIGKQMGFLKWFLRWSFKKGHHQNIAYDTFKPKLKTTSKKVIFLTWDELNKLKDYQIPKDKQYLERVRDVFLFCCFTSLRYSDVRNLKRSDVKSDHIEITTVKTADSLTIELNKYSKAILDKYKDIHFENYMALPVISNQKMNDYLKELGELAEINEPVRETYYKGNERIDEVTPKYALLSTHAGRRTFICNALALGIPAQVVMKWTGHSDYKAMKPYIDIADDIKANAMNKFNQL
jgi:integrase